MKKTFQLPFLDEIAQSSFLCWNLLWNESFFIWRNPWKVQKEILVALNNSFRTFKSLYIEIEMSYNGNVPKNAERNRWLSNDLQEKFQCLFSGLTPWGFEGFILDDFHFLSFCLMFMELIMKAFFCVGIFVYLVYIVRCKDVFRIQKGRKLKIFRYDEMLLKDCWKSKIGKNTRNVKKIL